MTTYLLDRWAPRSTALGAGLVAIALTACGSTVQVRSADTLGQDGLGSSGTTATAEITAGAGTPDAASSGTTHPSATAEIMAGAGTPDAASSASTDDAASSGTPDASSVTNAGTAPGTGHQSTGGQQHGAGTAAADGAVDQGVASDEPIRIGIIYTPGIEQAAAALGVDGLTTGDTEAQAEAVISWIGANGGLGGHPIQVFSHALNGYGAADFEAACTAMTQDYEVRYVVAVVALVGAPGFLPCLAEGGVGLLNDGTGLGDEAMATYAHALANPGEMAPGRTMSVLVDDLWERGWLTPGSRVGILATDSVDGHAVVDGPLTAALRRHGLQAASTQYVTISDAGASQASGVALQFRSAGVDRVIPVLISPLFLMQAASSQRYQPAYALYSILGPGALLETAAPRDQLTDAAGVGYQPFSDIGSGTNPGPVSSRETLCFGIMDEAGQASTSPTTKTFQLQVCNVLFYLKDLSDQQPTMPPDLFTSGRALIGHTFVSADTFRTDVTHRTDGVAGYRSLAYLENCACFEYVSPIKETS